MLVRIKKMQIHPVTNGSSLILGLIFWYVFAAVLTGFFGVSKIVVYFGDIINLWLFINAIFAINRRTILQKNSVLLWMIIFILVSTTSAIINGVSPILFLWGARQNFRFFLFYFSCVTYLRKEHLQVIFKFITIIFWISLPLCIYEARFVVYPRGTIVGDYVGGIYYGIQGVNAPLNIILIIYCTITLIKYFDKEKTFKFVVLVFGSALVMSSLAELKIFLVEIVIISLIIMLKRGVSIKSIIFILFGIFVMSITVKLFVQFNGTGRAYYNLEYLSIKGMIENQLRTTGYDGTGDLNRFFAVQTLTKEFFSDDILGLLFGIGLGNAEYSQGFDFLTSEFYKNYSWMHYQYFSVSFIFIETGLIGLISYFMIFISGFVQGVVKLPPKTLYSNFYNVMIVIMLMLLVYNPSLRNEQCAFILYLILAMPMIKDIR